MWTIRSQLLRSQNSISKSNTVETNKNQPERVDKPSAARPASRLEGIMDDTIVVEKPGETHKQLTNLEELDEICEALKVMKLKTDNRNSLAARLGKVIEKMKSEQDEEETKPKQNQYEQLANMFQDIMKEVKEVNIAINSTKTYAQVAATPPVDQKKTFITSERKQELEKAKKERK